jgi:exonuclease III
MQPWHVQWTKTDNLYIRTWNIKTLLKPGKLQELAEEIKKTQIEILALQEVRLPGKGQIIKKDYSFYFSRTKEKTRQAGTGFLFKKNMQKYLISYELHNECLCKIE